MVNDNNNKKIKPSKINHLRVPVPFFVSFKFCTRLTIMFFLYACISAPFNRYATINIGIVDQLDLEEDIVFNGQFITVCYQMLCNQSAWCFT